MDEKTLERAWALKAQCYAAWHSEPQRTRWVADEVARLAACTADAAVAALACWTDGIALLAEGRLEQALARLEQAQRRFSETGDELHAAQTQVPQMGVLTLLGREDEVLVVGREALARFADAGDSLSAGKVEINLGTSLSRQDRHAEAERAYRSAAARFEGLGDDELVAMAQIGLANALTWQFRTTAALRAAARARRLARRAGHVILHAQSLEATGQIELNRGRYGAALTALAKALGLLERSGAAPHRRLECELALADAYAGVNLVDDAARLYERAAAEAERLPAPSERALATLQLARVLARNERHEAALAALGEARRCYRALGNTASTALTELCIARVELALQRPAQALQTARATAAALAPTGIRGWVLEARVLEAAAQAALGEVEAAATAYGEVLAEAGDLAHVAAQCQAGIGCLALAQGELPLARTALERALQHFDTARLALPADDLRSALGREAEPLHDSLVEVALREHDPKRLLHDIDRGRSRALAHAVSGGGAAAHTAVLPGARWQQLRRAWHDAMAEDDASQLRQLDRQKLALEQQMLELHRQADLRARALKPGHQRPAAGAWTLASLDQALGPGQAMLVYHVHGSRLLMLVVRGGGVVQRETALKGDLEEHTAGLRMQVGSRRLPQLVERHAARLERRLRDHAQALHAQLWAPVADLLVGYRDVVLVPHGPLHDVPFALLHDGHEWLVQQHCLSVVPSASVWLALQQRPWRLRPAGVVAVAAPGLTHAEREIDAVAAVHGERTTLLRGPQASAEQLRAAATAGIDIVHLACHAHFRADSPAFSTLALADGPLPMHELARWRLPARLVVLSACETGVSRIAPGDEAFGLVRAVLMAGARTVLATQWIVDDAATADLLAAFHGGLRGGLQPAEALRDAQRTAVRAGLHPYFWGAFVLHGVG